MKNRYKRDKKSKHKHKKGKRVRKEGEGKRKRKAQEEWGISKRKGTKKKIRDLKKGTNKDDKIKESFIKGWKRKPK